MRFGSTGADTLLAESTHRGCAGCEPASATPQNLTPQTWSPSSSWSARPDTPPDPESGCPPSPASPAAASAGRPAADAGTHRLKSALFLAAFCSPRSPESKTYYQRKRAEGKRRNPAVNCLARHRCDIILVMLKTATP